MTPKYMPSITQSEVVTNTFMQRVYLYMTGALTLTGVTAFITASIPGVIAYMPFILILELIVVLVLIFMIDKMSIAIAGFMFVLYSILNGATLSVVLLSYTTASVGLAFFIAASTFGVMSLYGYFTKTDLTSFGKIMIMGLFGCIIAIIINLFLQSPGFDYILSFIVVLVFTGLTAYDTQRLKDLGEDKGLSPENIGKIAIMGALTLYLDFINLFLYILKLFGKRN